MGLKSNLRELTTSIIIVLIIFSFSNSLLFTDDFILNSEENTEKNSFVIEDNNMRMQNYQQDCNDILIHDDLLYFVGGRARIVNISTPKTPIFYYYNNTREIEPAKITCVGNYIFVCFEYYYGEKLAIIDLEKNFTELKIIPELNFTSAVYHGVNDKLYVLNDTDYDQYDHLQFVVYDISESGNLSLRVSQNIVRGSYGYDFYLVDDYVFLTTNKTQIVIYQLNSTYHLNFIKQYSVDSRINNFFFSENSLVICKETGLAFYNYTNPMNLTLQDEYTNSNIKSLFIIETIAFLITEREIIKFDVSDITNIDLLRKHTISDRIYGDLKKIIVKDNELYIMTEYTCSTGEYYEDFLLIYNANNLKRIYPNYLPLPLYTKILLFTGSNFVIIIVFVVTVLIKASKKNDKKLKMIYEEN
ncbi:MAG: hypothetical protein ACFFDW_10590 [Candidatus Thorarchaeota archaeon]